MRRFDRVIIADWSAANAPSPARPKPDAIWISDGSDPLYFRTRHLAETFLQGQITQIRARGQSALIGFDFPMGYPAGFARALTGRADVREIWAYLAARITDTDRNKNNRFAVADAINARFGAGPFWARPAALALPHLPIRKTIDYADFPFAERRAVELKLPRAQPVWKLFTTGAVGSQSLMGLPMIHRLAQMDGVCVWPFDPPTAPVVLAEVYPSILADQVAAARDPIKDRAQVALLARALLGLTGDEIARLLAQSAPEEGWILGALFAPLLASKL